MKHGHSKRGNRTRTFVAWDNMHQRCKNHKNTYYAGYGGRGISVCDRWNNFNNFLEDMNECPEKMTIDRLDNDGNYEPENCKWSTAKEQARNRRSTRFVFIKDNSISLAEACETLGISYGAIYQRRKRTGKSIQEIINQIINGGK